MKENKKEVIEKECGTCRNFDNGICDYNGWIVEEDDFLCKGKGWEGELNGSK